MEHGGGITLWTSDGLIVLATTTQTWRGGRNHQTQPRSSHHLLLMPTSCLHCLIHLHLALPGDPQLDFFAWKAVAAF